MSRNPNVEREQARVAQMDAAQTMLFTMGVLDEKVAGYQLEIDGVVQCLIVRRVTQLEFLEIMKTAVAAAGARAQRGPGGGDAA